MKLRIATLICAVIFTLTTLLSLFVIIVHNVRWDKIPIISFFVLEINLKPAGFNADGITEPIRWDQIDVEPEEWIGTGRWFYFNAYTKNLLKDYMKENNLGIVPGDWPDFKMTSNFEECLETFEFVELDESYRTPVEMPLETKVFIISGCIALVFWAVFFVLVRPEFKTLKSR